jgi:hypothetical protein
VSARSPAADPLLAGGQELGEARWGEARGLFERALDGEETPDAWEGLSWAAWWLDDAEAVFGARECAYALQSTEALSHKTRRIVKHCETFAEPPKRNGTQHAGQRRSFLGGLTTSTTRGVPFWM